MHYTHIHTAPDVFLVQVPFKNYKLEATNCYVIRDGGEALLVDTGAPSEKSCAYLREALKELGVNPAKAGFFLTHLHMDHAGLIDPIAPPQAPIYLNERDYREACPEGADRHYAELEQALVREGMSADEANELVSRRRSRAGIFTGTHNLKFVQEGDTVSVGAYTLQVLGTAGHTPGHQALYEPQSGIAFCGDHVLLTLSPGVGLFLPEGDSVQTYIDNLRKVANLGLNRLYFSHGPMRDDFEERIDWLIEHNRQRAEQVRTIVGDNPGIDGFHVTRRIDFNVPFDCWEDISRVQRLSLMEIGASFLRHLEHVGRIEVRVDETGVRRYFPA